VNTNRVMRNFLIVFSSLLLATLALLHLIDWTTKYTFDGGVMALPFICLGFWFANQISPIEWFKQPFQGWFFSALCLLAIAHQIIPLFRHISGSLPNDPVLYLLLFYVVAIKLISIGLLAAILFNRRLIKPMER